MLQEVVMSGTVDNDYPDGDYVTECVWCHKSFHGEYYNRICYACNNYDYKNRPDTTKKNPVPILATIMIIAHIAIVLGVLFL